MPTVAFFFTTPVILLALYANLHFYVLRLWTALAALPAKLPTDDPKRRVPLSEALQPWLLTDAAILLKRRSPTAAFSRLAFALAVFLAWWLGPLVLAAFWIRSWAYHAFFLSLFLAAVLAFALWLGFTTYSLGRKRLRRGSPALTPRPRKNTSMAIAFIGFFAALGLVTIVATKVHVHGWIGPGGADLYRAEIALRPANWIPRHQAKAILLAAEANRDKPREQAIAEFTEQRNHFLLSFAANDLSGADLRRADMRYAFLPAVLMERADLRGAQLYSAQLEGALMKWADLSHARLNSTELSCARLPGAHFDNAEMHSVRLHRAELTGARLRGARLIRADLTEADISHANLTDAVLDGADLTNASLSMANLSGADLSKAKLGQTDLGGAIGDADTRLPAGIGPLPTCFPATLARSVRARIARLWGLDIAEFEQRFVCSGARTNPMATPVSTREPERCWPLASGEERGQVQADESDP